MEKPKKNKFSKKKGPPHMKGLGSGRGKMPPWKRGPFPDPSWAPEGNLPPWMKDELPDDMSWGNEFPGRMEGPFPNEMCGPWRGGPPDMGPPFPDEMGGPWRGGPPDMGPPFPDEMGRPWRGGPPDMGPPFPDEMGGPWRGGPPDMGPPFPDEMGGPWRGGPPDMGPPFPDEMGGPWRGGPPDMGPPFPDEMCGRGRGRPPRMRGPFPGGMCRPRRGGPPQMGHPFPDERGGPGRHIPPVMGDPFPDEMCGPGRGVPFPDERGGPGRHIPPVMGDPFPDEMCGPGRGVPFPDERGGPGRHIPPVMGDPFPDEMCGPGRGGPFPDERGGPGRHIPPVMGDPFPDEMCGPGRGGPFPDERGGPGRHIPPVMGDPFPDEMCGPGRGGPFPDEMCGSGSGRPPHTGGPFPDEMCGPRGGMSPHMRGPFPDEMQETGRDIWPLMRGPCPDGMVGPRGNMPPEGRDHCWPEEREAEGNMSLPRNGPQTPDLWPSRSVPTPEGDLHQAGAYGARLQQSDARGLFCSNNESLPPGNRSSDQPLTSGKNAESMSARSLYLQESAAKILETFGLSTEDFNELCRYPDDQLKPENIPTILEDIRKRKRAGQWLSLPSKKTFGRDGLHVSPVESEVSMVVQPTVPEPQMLLDSSEAEKMKNCPNPSVMNDYYSVSPKVFPHVCSLCKIECRHLKGWSLHLSTTAHSESCQQLRQQYPNWNPEDSFWLKRYRGSKNTHHPKMRQSAGSSPERSGCSRPRTRSRSRSPRRDRTSRPTAQSPGHQLSPTRPPAGAQPSQAAAAAPKETERPGSSKADHPSVLSKGLGHLEQPKDTAAGQEQESEEGKKPLSNPPQLPLSGLVEKSVVQAMSLFQPGGTVTAGLGQGTSLTSLPPLQIDPEAVTKGLVSMMQMVATQVVQAVLASREVSGGQVSSGGAGVSSQPSDSTRKKEEDKKEDKQEQGVPSIPPQPVAAPRSKEVYICGHSVVCRARDRAIETGQGSQLGLGDKLHLKWLCQEDMKCDQLIPLLQQEVPADNPPKAIVVQLGENDIGTNPSIRLIWILRDNFVWCAEHFPGTLLFWSEIVSKRGWREELKSPVTEKKFSRLPWKINKGVRSFVKPRGVSVISHSRISHRCEEFYKEDGFHLSEAGLDIWLEDIRSVLEGLQ